MFGQFPAVWVENNLGVRKLAEHPWAVPCGSGCLWEKCASPTEKSVGDVGRQSAGPSWLELPEGGFAGATEVLSAGELAHGVDEALLVAGVEEARELHVLGKEGVRHLAAGV